MSDSLLSPRHHELRGDVRHFAEKVVARRVRRMERQWFHTFDRRLPRKIAQKGWIGVTIAPEYGGMGQGHLAKTLIIEELSRSSGAAGAIAQASMLGASMIQLFGSRRQQQRWLPHVAAGKCLPTIAVTEEESGSHIRATQLTAERRGDTYVLTGRKVYIGNSHVGHVHGVLARTGPAELTAFLVEKGTPGLRLPHHTRRLGLRGFSFGEVIFDRCRIPVSHRLGDEGQGEEVALTSSIGYGRLNLAAVALGVHQAVLDQVVAFTSARERYGKPLYELQNIKVTIGEIASALTTARLTAYHAARQIDQGQPRDDELQNAKLVNTESLRRSVRTAMEIHGAAGLLTTRPLERHLRDAECLVAPAGTSDIQRLLLADAALGQRTTHYSQRLSNRH
ncbi:acyl-CoA dehydrogenase family protein [Streptomyces spectabilis]|uniref:Alkylation response protein AidB-like acyl-CoA dehydrogenase n=1 Tax=Streptomyces spectabilis TaxID=68270 RepID=A0A7W8B514_STRST|nr:acyl-CoA dehydrogenase family protein [Streptomyces spectabilis]MBB5108997.1 alkylation response protein AidB-like acyl-CoA dehydrogenase [Streptomyces spectabilis]GGV50574.1 acyl-CoA dehydrogenase [Streptomyces spectabilis]